MSPQHDVIRASYEAFNARDLDAALAAVHPDVDWPNAIDGGRVRGREQVRDYWSRQFETIDPHVDPVAFSEDAQGRIVVDVHQVVRDLDGTLMADQHVEHLYTITAGLIARMDIRELPDQQPQTLGAGEWPWPAELDGAIAAPDSHRILLETPAVRVLEVVIEPSSREPEHTHRNRSVMIVDAPARSRYYEHGDLTFESPPGPGPEPPRVIWMDPDGPHSVENIDTTSYHAFRVEILC